MKKMARYRSAGALGGFHTRIRARFPRDRFARERIARNRSSPYGNRDQEGSPTGVHRDQEGSPTGKTLIYETSSFIC